MNEINLLTDTNKLIKKTFRTLNNKKSCFFLLVFLTHVFL